MFLVSFRWNEKGRWVQEFILLPQKVESFHSSLSRAMCYNLVCVCVCVECLKIIKWFVFSQSNKQDTFWHVVWTGYFYVLFSWAIAVSDFLELLLSTLTFTVNSHADDHFYKFIYLFQILCSMKSVFFSHVKVFYYQIWFMCEIPLLFYLIRTMV